MVTGAKHTLPLRILRVQVSVIPLNDGPIVQFNPDADIDKFASLADRSHAVELIEEGLPVPVMPNTTTATDVDSRKAGGATIQLIGIKDGTKEVLTINKSLAQTFQVNVSVSVSALCMCMRENFQKTTRFNQTQTVL